jgi:ABC-2 type transport system ATP-binding protein
MDEGRIIKTGTPKQLIDELVASGFTRHEEVKKATLEDVFLNLTGRTIRDE